MGDKFATLLQWMASFIVGYIIGFVYSWKLTLVIISVASIIAGSLTISSKVITIITLLCIFIYPGSINHNKVLDFVTLNNYKVNSQSFPLHRNLDQT